MRRLFSVGFLFLLIASCKREEYITPEDAQPIFKMSGTIDGEPFTLAAGQNQVYQTAQIEFNSFGVYEFRSSFRQHNCEGCEPLLEVLISADEIQQQYDPVDSDILSPGNVEYTSQPNVSDYLSIHFDIQNDFNTSYSWDFGDGNSGGGHEPSHAYASAGIYEVILTQSNPGWSSDIVVTQSILVGEQVRLAKPFGIWNEPGDEWSLTLPGNLPPGLEPEYWTINGTNYPASNLELSLDGVVEVCLYFHNSEINQDGYYCVEFDADQPGNPDYFINYQWMSPELNLGKVALRYRSANGAIYSSYTVLNESDPNVNFIIEEVVDYPNGIDGHPAKKMKATFNVFLLNENDPSDMLHFENVQAELGFIIE